MAARASRSAHLAAVDALTEQDHLSCRAFRNGKIARSRPCAWMLAPWRLGRRNLFLVVPDHGIGRPMGGKSRSRSNFVRAYADRFAAVATVFRSQNQLLHERVVVALGPAIIPLCLQ